MSPKERYLHAVCHGLIQQDSEQLRIITQFEVLHKSIIARAQSRRISWLPFTRIFPLRGIYLWGDVGCGKTLLMDYFYESVPSPQKTRIHFHRLMRMVHNELSALKEQQDPLEFIASKLSRTSRLLCIDEFHVSDIADAMLLGGLLRALFKRDVVLVMTSNEPPKKLYWQGLQRQSFLPAIRAIEAHTHVLSLNSSIDYRLRSLSRAPVYCCPLSDTARDNLAHHFDRLSENRGTDEKNLLVEDRQINIINVSEQVVWFDFYAICDGARGNIHYLEIARCYGTVLISDIPAMNDESFNLAQRFILLVDTLYDRQVKLVVSAAALPDQLYEGSRLASSFKRTVSRLHEMQTHDYLTKPHLA